MEIEEAKVIEETKDEVKFIMIGGNDPAMAKDIVEVLTDKATGATIYELDDEEMQFITNHRMRKAETDTMESYLAHEDNKNQAKYIATQFYDRWDEFQNGEFVSKSEVKKETTFSWKKFDEILATLDMFGHIAWSDDKKSFKVILDDSDILANKKREAQAVLNIAKGHLVELQGMVTTKKEKDKLETMKKRMELTI